MSLFYLKAGEGSTAAQSVSYQYNAGGLRVSKTADGVTTNYTLHGKLITHLKKGSDQMHFFYDAQGKPAMVQLNGTHYTYVHNLQGDIVAILDAANVKVVEYKYDAWGKPTSTWSLEHATNSTLTTEYAKLAQLNPFRYRGYVYDQETGLYYLRSRYYDPVWGRFVSGDMILSVYRILGCAVYTYCANRPIMMNDPEGTSPISFLLGIGPMMIGGAMIYNMHKPRSPKTLSAAQVQAILDEHRNRSMAFQIAQKYMSRVSKPKHYIRAFAYPPASDEVADTIKNHLGVYGYDAHAVYIFDIGNNMYSCTATNRKTGKPSVFEFEVKVVSHRTLWGWTCDILGAIAAAGSQLQGNIGGIDVEAAITAIDGATNLAGLLQDNVPPSHYSALTVTRWWQDSVEIWDLYI